MIENEIIGDKEKGFDFTETISPEVIETPNYDYGRSQEPLDFNRLKNKPNGGNNFYATTIQQSISTTTNITITPGFPIKYIEIEAYNNGNPGGECNTLFITNGNSAKGTYKSWSFTGSAQIQNIGDFNSTTSCLRIDNYNTSNNIRARIENITSTSFDLNFYEVEYTGYITAIIKCFG